MDKNASRVMVDTIKLTLPGVVIYFKYFGNLFIIILSILKSSFERFFILFVVDKYCNS
ncbi:hypothetical protein Calni_2098 (plasmid) [Calditerrivibrio nitroreducens DSM 19672]|uniref:Uncharacterized protein n=1 Tax=Calditerrivibrio nitroreducens (strain DSM 19672 / NBRC 101217 / Yu37-1) TaxID=768670 RepID=E4TKB6_CALNY|nr:hypothetical protein Calni_2098 [Calditerrivibrio nitroreducens DSM 19672]